MWTPWKVKTLAEYEEYRTLKDWLLAFWYAQHNARVIDDFEHRMGLVLYEATNGVMSKPYYSVEAMRAEIIDTQNKIESEGFESGREHGEMTALGY